MADIFDDQPFYELMQQYRLAPLVPQRDVLACFEAVKDFARAVIASEREACKEIADEYSCRSMIGDDGIAAAEAIEAAIEMRSNVEFSGGAPLFGAASAGTQGYASKEEP